MLVMVYSMLSILLDCGVGDVVGRRVAFRCCLVVAWLVRGCVCVLLCVAMLFILRYVVVRGCLVVCCCGSRWVVCSRWCVDAVCFGMVWVADVV